VSLASAEDADLVLVGSCSSSTGMGG
jgi:hypothetical protein